MMKDARTKPAPPRAGSLATRARPKRIVLVDESPL